MYYDVNVITEKMKQMFPKPLEKMYYNEIIDAIKKDKKYGFKHIALKIMSDGLKEHTRDYKKYIDLQNEYFEFKHKYIETTQSLKQQVREEVVEEIKQQIFNHFKVKNIEEYEKLSLIDSLFTADTVIEILDTILKKYGG